MPTAPNPPTITIEPEFDLAYLKLTNRTIVRTEKVEDGVNVDLDDVGIVVGVEVLSIATLADNRGIFDRLTKDYHVTSSQVTLLQSAPNVMLSTTSAISRSSPSSVSAVADLSAAWRGRETTNC